MFAHSSQKVWMVLFALALSACGGGVKETGVGKVAAGIPVATPEGASASGGDERVAPKAFKYDCRLSYSDYSSELSPGSEIYTTTKLGSHEETFSVDEKNYRQKFETAEYDIYFSPRWEDFPTPQWTISVHLIVKAPEGALTQNTSRSMAQFPYDQKKIRLWIYNDQGVPKSKTRKRAVSLECDKV